MKKTTLAISLIIALVVIPISALALPVHVDFGSALLDITNQTQTVDSINFNYIPELLGSDLAFINPADPPYGPLTGIAGNSGATGNSELQLDFAAVPVTELQYLLITFNLPGLTVYDGGEIQVFFYNAGSMFEGYSMSLADPITGGTLEHYASMPYDAISIYFTMDAPIFEITDIAYDKVPEPSTIILLTSGLLGLGILRITKRKN